MQELVLGTQKVIRIYEDESKAKWWDIKKPSNKQLVVFLSQHKTSGDDPMKSYLAMVDFLCELGLPKEVSEAMGPNDTQLIIEALTPKKNG